uniref:Secreted protein n=1 Tax=Ascaris lumbricoides TaxID=6252 RepID=A0A0M3I062_ASCLU
MHASEATATGINQRRKWLLAALALPQLAVLTHSSLDTPTRAKLNGCLESGRKDDQLIGPVQDVRIAPSQTCSTTTSKKRCGHPHKNIVWHVHIMKDHLNNWRCAHSCCHTADFNE